MRGMVKRDTRQLMELLGKTMIRQVRTYRKVAKRSGGRLSDRCNKLGFQAATEWAGVQCVTIHEQCSPALTNWASRLYPFPTTVFVAVENGTATVRSSSLSGVWTCCYATSKHACSWGNPPGPSQMSTITTISEIQPNRPSNSSSGSLLALWMSKSWWYGCSCPVACLEAR